MRPNWKYIKYNETFIVSVFYFTYDTKGDDCHKGKHNNQSKFHFWQFLDVQEINGSLGINSTYLCDRILTPPGRLLTCKASKFELDEEHFTSPLTCKRLLKRHACNFCRIYDFLRVYQNVTKISSNDNNYIIDA